VHHHRPSPFRTLGVLAAAVATAAALWVAASPPATSTVAPGATAHGGAGQP
jgi:hypothetical protein